MITRFRRRNDVAVEQDHGDFRPIEHSDDLRVCRIILRRELHRMIDDTSHAPFDVIRGKLPNVVAKLHGIRRIDIRKKEGIPGLQCELRQFGGNRLEVFVIRNPRKDQPERAGCSDFRDKSSRPGTRSDKPFLLEPVKDLERRQSRNLESLANGNDARK